MRTILALFLASLVGSLWGGQVARHEGVIGDAKFLILVPENRNQRVLLLAHGYRLKENPLSAEFNTEGIFAQNLLEDGWTIASTSYRRNGWIVEDALLDLNLLHEKALALVGLSKMTLLMGSSMGGQIVTRAAEGELAFVNGAVAIGAALQDFPGKEFSPKLTFEPKVPLLFLSNESELEHPQRYRENAQSTLAGLWPVERPGHCNVSDGERFAALQAVARAASGGEWNPEKNGTLPPPRHPSTAELHEGRWFGKVTKASESWGNLTTSLVSADLAKLELKLKDQFTIKSAESELKVILVEHYSQVPQKSGAAYLTPDGFLRVQINGASAAEFLKVKAGSEISLAATKKPE